MTYAWFKTSDGRQVYRKASQVEHKRSDLPMPQIMSDRFSEPVKSMADGKYYESKSALRATYKADGNPQGVEYTEVGNTDLTKFEKPKRDKAADMAAFKRAEAEVASGTINPKVLVGSPTDSFV